MVLCGYETWLSILREERWNFELNSKEKFEAGSKFELWTSRSLAWRSTTWAVLVQIWIFLLNFKLKFFKEQTASLYLLIHFDLKLIFHIITANIGIYGVMWIWNMTFYIKGGTVANGIWKQVLRRIFRTKTDEIKYHSSDVSWWLNIED